jgi:hypothetical protein
MRVRVQMFWALASSEDDKLQQIVGTGLCRVLRELAPAHTTQVQL